MDMGGCAHPPMFLTLLPNCFQVGAEALHYDGPLKVRIPLDVLM